MKNLLFPFLLVFCICPSLLLAQWLPGYATYDPAFNTGYVRHECSAIAVTIDSQRLCVLLGGRGGAGNTAKRRPILYDFDQNTLTMGKNFNDQIHHFQAALWRDSVIVLGMAYRNGYPNEIPYDHLYLYYVKSDTWVQQDTIPTARKRGSAQCVVIGDEAYFFNGITDGHNTGYVNWTDRYDFVTGVWDTLAPSPHARDHAIALLEGSKVYIVGGRNSVQGAALGTPRPEIDVYDIPTNTWTTLPATANLQDVRGGIMGVIGTNDFGNKQINVWGGELPGDTQISGAGLDLSTLTWFSLPDLVAPVHASGICQMADDTLVMMAGAVRTGAANTEYLVTTPSYVQIYRGRPTVLSADWMHWEVRLTERGFAELIWSLQGEREGVFTYERRIRMEEWQELGQRAVTMLGLFSGSFIDSSRVSPGTALQYRVRFRSLTGEETMSPVLSVVARRGAIAYPNPLPKENRTLFFPKGSSYHVMLRSMQGQLIASSTVSDSWQLPESLASGRYLLQVAENEGYVQQILLDIE